MTRILHVIHGLPRGGLENGVVNLANRLPQSDFVQAICCLDQVGEMADRLNPGIEVLEVNRRAYDFGAPFRLAAIFRRWQPDIIHCRNWNAWLDTTIAKILGAPRAVLVWSFHGFSETDYFPWRRQVASRLLARMTDRLFAVCHDSAERFTWYSGIDSRRFSILYNGVDTERYSYSTKDKDRLRLQLGLPQDVSVAITTASLTPVKDHNSLLEAASRVVEYFQGKILFLWLGNGPLRESLESRIEQLGLEGVIKLQGNVDNVSDYLAASDFFVLPSRLEGMSNAILEAMSAGLPVIANDVGGNKELVVHGETGFLCKYGEIVSMAESISQLIGNPQLRNYQAIRARERAVEKFSLNIMIQRYSELYHGLVS